MYTYNYIITLYIGICVLITIYITLYRVICIFITIYNYSVQSYMYTYSHIFCSVESGVLISAWVDNLLARRFLCRLTVGMANRFKAPFYHLKGEISIPPKLHLLCANLRQVFNHILLRLFKLWFMVLDKAYRRIRVQCIILQTSKILSLILFTRVSFLMVEKVILQEYHFWWCLQSPLNRVYLCIATIKQVLLDLYIYIFNFNDYIAISWATVSEEINTPSTSVTK